MSDDSLVPKRALNYWQLVCFGFLTTPIAMSGLALVMYIPTHYSVNVGLGFTAVGIIFALGRLFDVISDPLIGYLSDRTESRFGRRRSWILAGVPAFALAVWLMLAPPDDVGLPYLFFVSMFFFLSLTILDIPYSSIGLELSPDVHERSSLAGSKATFQVAGAILAAALPAVFLLSIDKALMWIAVLVVLFSAVGLVLFWRFVPDPNVKTPPVRLGLTKVARTALANRQFRSLITAFFVVQSATSLTAGLAVLFISHNLAAPQLVGPLILLLFVSTALFIPVWIWLSKRTSKKQAWLVSIVFCASVLCGAFLLAPGSVIGAVLLFALIGSVFGCDAIMPTSMLADIVDEDRIESSSMAGLFLAFKNASSKMTFIFPMALAFPMLDLVDFQKEGINGGPQLMTLVLLFAGLPILLRLGAAWLLYRAEMLQPASSFQKGAEAHEPVV